MLALLTQSPCGTVQTGIGKVDPARKLKMYCTAARELDVTEYFTLEKVTWITLTVPLMTFDEKLNYALQDNCTTNVQKLILKYILSV